MNKPNIVGPEYIAELLGIEVSTVRMQVRCHRRHPFTYAIVCGLMCAKRSYRDILIRTTMHNSKSLDWRRIGNQISLCFAA